MRTHSYHIIENGMTNIADRATNDNQRIEKNAVMLYVRMFITMIVRLYTSRVVLSVLGIEDTGTKRFPEPLRDGRRGCLTVIQR